MKITHLIIIIVAFVGFIFILGSGNDDERVLNFDDCVVAGNAVMESYPRRCQSDGITFVEDIGNELEKAELIRIDTPRPNQRINSPLIIKGEAVGTWFFEGDFAAELKDSNGRVLGSVVVRAEEDAMTEEMVPYLATLNFENSSTTKGDLFLIKDNPTDDPEKDDVLRVPVIFQIN